MIEKIESQAKVNEFIRFPWRIYRDYPNWVPPLIKEQQEYLDREKNPFFRDSEADLFLARDEYGRVVGRIAAVQYRKHLEMHRDNTGFFVFFECIDDQDMANALFGKVENWLNEKKLTRMRGPMSFTINDDCGLLVAGFEHEPAVGMPYHPPYYEKLFTSYGLSKSQDLYAYLFKPEYVKASFREQVMATAARVEENGGSLRPVKVGKGSELDCRILQQVYEEAWEGNWGHIPMTVEDFSHFARKNQNLFDPRLCWIIEYQGEPAGMIFAFPDYGPAIKSMNGRVFPFGWLRFMLARRKIRKFRVILLGILRPYQNLGLESLVLKKMDIEYPQSGYVEGEFSWILESNRKVISIIKRIGTRQYKTYRIFDKEIAPG